MRQRRRTGIGVPAVAVLLVSGCGGSVGSGLSVSQRVQTVTVCVDVAGSVRDAAQVGAEVASGSLPPSQAGARLGPVRKHVADLAAQNNSLPISKDLTSLADGITKIEGLNATAVSDVQAAGTQLTTSTKDLLAACAAVRH